MTLTGAAGFAGRPHALQSRFSLLVTSRCYPRLKLDTSVTAQLAWGAGDHHDERETDPRSAKRTAMTLHGVFTTLFLLPTVYQDSHVEPYINKVSQG